MVSRTNSPWSRLHSDMLDNISKRLDIFAVSSFRASCSAFRSPLPLRHPLIPFPIQLHQNKNVKGCNLHFRLVENHTLLIQPQQPRSNNESYWLIKVEALDADGKVNLELKTPLSREPFEDHYNELPKCLDLIQNKVKVVATSYVLELVESCGIRKKELHMPKKVAVSPKGGTDDDLIVMAIHSDGKIYHWRQSNDQQWVHLDRGGHHYVDVAYHKRTFYALD
ncbi:hypothetical protein RJT34_02033 [Clitoria ternatea]|uniref:KIB1-4 beta-propeller domain-containing protein n=1 Tax=Clitoria ternatea TaxID=43366 RepID=A0AAN9KK36_CLITE